MSMDPNQVGCADGGLFGFGYSIEEAQIVVLPIPWDVTTSYKDGTAHAPDAILTASTQLDFYHPDFPDFYKTPIAMLPISDEWAQLNHDLRQKAKAIISFQEDGNTLQDLPLTFAGDLDHINQQSNALSNWIYDTATQYLSQGKRVVFLGGDHSTPLGYVRAVSDFYERSPFGILHIDAHMDLRHAYEGFEYSHASIMHNVMSTIPSVSKLTQVGIRDCCHDEVAYANRDSRITVFYQSDLAHRQFQGMHWHELCLEIIQTLPERVYISLDVDGLSPDFCPNTGTPVPGGLSFDQCVYLIKCLHHSNRKIIGFDLVETGVSPSTDYDANVSARLLFHLAGYLSLST